MNNAMNGNAFQMLKQFMQFKKSFKGDPKTEIDRLLNSGKITADQLDQARQLATEIESLLK